MYFIPTHKLILLKQMSNTLVAANVTTGCLRIENDAWAREKKKLEMINLNLSMGNP